MPAMLFVGCAHPAAKAVAVPSAPDPGTAPTPSAPAPIVMAGASYPTYQPLPPGRQTKSLSLGNTTPGDNSVPASGSPQASNAPSQSAVAQGQVSLDDYQFQILPDGAGGSVLDGSASVHNHGPYDITDFQVSLREGGRLYVLVPPGGGHQISPAQGTMYNIHAAVPLPMEQLKTGKIFLLEAQLDGPPGLATDEESGTTTLSTVPQPIGH